MGLNEDHKKYRWFFTRTGKLVVGGKSAVQNDELLNKVIEEGRERIVMHTETPGSPFAVILEDKKSISEQDIRECSVFTGCFSRNWREGKRSCEVQIFDSSRLSKKGIIKKGSWIVSGKVKRVNVELKLALVMQKEILRAIPPLSVADENEVLGWIIPGKEKKEDIVEKLAKMLEKKTRRQFKRDEILGALPSGGIKYDI